MASKKQKEAAWDKAKPIRGRNPNLWRRDDLGNKIYKPAYGTNGQHGWELDHRNPQARGGTDNPRNLRALQTEANRKKGKKYPYK